MLGAILVGLLAAFGTSLVVMNALAVREARKFRLFPDRPFMSSRYTVCQTGPVEDCAEGASSRVGFPVAWMVVPHGFRLRSVLAITSDRVPLAKHVAELSFRSDDVIITLESQPPAQRQTSAEVRIYPMGEGIAHAYVQRVGERSDGPWFLTFSWEHHGRQYGMSVVADHLFGNPPIRMDSYASLLPAIRYAELTTQSRPPTNR
jgi:hypothetical protein